MKSVMALLSLYQKPEVRGGGLFSVLYVHIFEVPSEASFPSIPRPLRPCEIVSLQQCVLCPATIPVLQLHRIYAQACRGGGN